MLKYLFTALSIALLLTFMILIGCSSSNPVVKPDKNRHQKPQETTEQQPPIDAEYQKKLSEAAKAMPKGESQVVTPEKDDPNSLSPITVQGFFTVLLNDGFRKGYTKEQMSNPTSWNDIIAEKAAQSVAFMINGEFKIDKVILLNENDEFVFAEQVAAKYKKDIKALAPGHWIFFLSFMPNQKNPIDFGRSYVGLRIENPRSSAVNRARTYKGFMFNEGDVFILRGRVSINSPSKKPS